MNLPANTYDCDPTPVYRERENSYREQGGGDSALTEDELMQNLQIDPIEPGEDPAEPDPASHAKADNATPSNRRGGKHGGGGTHQQPTTPPSNNNVENRVKNSFDR